MSLLLHHWLLLVNVEDADAGMMLHAWVITSDVAAAGAGFPSHTVATDESTWEAAYTQNYPRDGELITHLPKLQT